MMATALMIVSWLLIGLLLIVVAIVCLPVRLHVRAQSAPHPTVQLGLQIFGGLTPSLPIIDRAKKAAKRPGKSKPKAAKNKSSRFSSARAIRLMRAAPDLILDLLRQFHVHHLHMDGVFGLGDPAATGQLYGQLTPLIYGTTTLRPITISLRPDFEKIQISGRADALISVIPVTLLAPAIRFAWRAFGPGK